MADLAAREWQRDLPGALISRRQSRVRVVRRRGLSRSVVIAGCMGLLIWACGPEGSGEYDGGSDGGAPFADAGIAPAYNPFGCGVAGFSGPALVCVALAGFFLRPRRRR